MTMKKPPEGGFFMAARDAGLFVVVAQLWQRRALA